MGFFDALTSLFGGGMKCPRCGTPGAKKSDEGILCLNPMCGNFDPARASRHPTAPPRNAAAAQPVPSPARPLVRGSSSSPTLGIQYRNFKSQSKIFTVEASSVMRRGNHILARLVPSGPRIALSRNRIQNMPDVDLILPEKDRTGAPRPSAREKQVLAYHKKYKTSSPLYEKIRAKYPNW